MKTATVGALDRGGRQASAEGQVLVGHLEPIDDPDQPPRELAVDRQLGVTGQHPPSAPSGDRHPVFDALRVVVAQGRLGTQGDQQVGRTGPVGQVGAGDEAQVREHARGTADRARAGDRAGSWRAGLSRAQPAGADRPTASVLGSGEASSARSGIR